MNFCSLTRENGHVELSDSLDRVLSRKVLQTLHVSNIKADSRSTSGSKQRSEKRALFKSRSSQCEQGPISQSVISLVGGGANFHFGPEAFLAPVVATGEQAQGKQNALKILSKLKPKHRRGYLFSIFMSCTCKLKAIPDMDVAPRSVNTLSLKHYDGKHFFKGMAKGRKRAGNKTGAWLLGFLHGVLDLAQADAQFTTILEELCGLMGYEQGVILPDETLRTIILEIVLGPFDLDRRIVHAQLNDCHVYY